MSNWSVINAPSFQTVAIGGLATAIQSARPGTVITVEEAGPPTALTLSATKAGYGVCVSLPPISSAAPSRLGRSRAALLTQTTA